MNLGIISTIIGLIGALLAYVFNLRLKNKALQDQLGQAQGKERLNEWSDKINQELANVKEVEKDYSDAKQKFIDNNVKPKPDGEGQS